MVERNCRGCDHFVDSGHSVGTCRRYPQYQNRSPNDRCGEFTALEYGSPEIDMLALPVVSEPPKRKGRPPKVSYDH
jgi:hypothetical protein